MVSADGANVTYSAFKWVPSSNLLIQRTMYIIRTFLAHQKLNAIFQ